MRPMMQHHPLRTLPALSLCCATLIAPPALAQADAAPAGTAATTVEVTGARFRDQPGRTSLSGAELARVPGAGGDPMRAIQALPGVATVDDSSSEPAVRGSRPFDNVYFVDFLPVGYLFHVGGFTSVFNPNLIQRFSMASAAWGPEYGQAVGAVFDVQLRNPRTDRIGGLLDFSLTGANVLAEGPIGHVGDKGRELSFFVAARRSWFDLVADSAEDQEEGVSFQLPVYTDSQARLLWSPDARYRVRLDFSTATDRIEYTVKAGGKAAARDPLVTGSSNQRQSFATGAVVLENDLSDTLGVRTALGQMRQNDSFKLGGAGTARVRTDTTYLRQQWQYTGWRGHELSFGGTLESRLLDVALDFNFPRCTEFDPNCDISTAPRLFTDRRARQNRADVHLADRWQLNPRWVAIAGLRLQRDSWLDRDAAEPRLGLEYSPTRDLTWSAGFGLHSQPPAAEESFDVIGNPKLAPIRSRHAVVGVSQRRAGGWSWRSEVYAKDFRGYAVADPVLNYRNGARGTAQGLELLLKKDLASGGPRQGWGALTGFASLTLSRSRRTIDATGEQFPFDADQPVIATVVANLPWNDRWSYGLKWSAHSGSPYTPVIGTNGTWPDGRVRPLFGGLNSQRLPAYHRLDLRADRRFTRDFSAYFELINAYNRQNVAGYSWNTTYTERETVQQLPIFFSFGLQLKL